MGLDQYAYIAKKSKDIKDIYDDDSTTFPYIVNDELAYWSKRYELQKWMFDLAKKKGFHGDRNDFNCVMVRLEEEDIEELRKEIKNRRFIKTVDWDHDAFKMDMKRGERFCNEAESAIEEGFAVYYDSWW